MHIVNVQNDTILYSDAVYLKLTAGRTIALPGLKWLRY